ncbi:chromosome segregation protein SMC [Myceligenerans salitolerans]|uniref:Chromosome partition protein Smc n=1 Tax=Myceligenerans salitolerans TaxID=1230528 RepID=A0ABS3IBK4_9MICO|nr:chromosome segregation protein SMC [Myceligenerans salitolerans]MBO0610006.1 chromosome segregation protein SMC [Myceligenerans salitolerans]
MHLKTLTLRGFKSFASATTLNLEPGITCVVGPNGSGKSNVVDALSWVMGEQGAKSLRGGKMDDVIFAGTSGRAPLGRAEVSLTIDNTDGALPIDYTEVTISRTLFRTGGSEYAINGSSCRLLDIQELLSDSGIGREMHVVVGQGQLDAVLRATPEERRGFIEEAAGVLKHRKRKEKALRKLDQMQGNLARLADLTAELRRQLGPLGRQAEAARKAQTVQRDLRDARARLLADDLAQLQAQIEADLADENALRERQAQAEAGLAEARAELSRLEQSASATSTEVSRAGDTLFALSQTRERLRALQSLADERARLLGTTEPAHHTGQDPDDLEAQAARARAGEEELAAEVEIAREAVEAAVEERAEAESAAQEAERAHGTLLRAAADRREGMARLAGQVAARRSRVEAAESELARLREAVFEAEHRAEETSREFAALESEVSGVEEGEEGLDVAHEAAVANLELARGAVERLTAEKATAEKERGAAAAKVEALELSLDRKDGAGTLLAANQPGVLGSVAALLGVEPGWEDAVAAALGPLADAVAVSGLDAAVDALRLLRDEDAGRASLVVGASPSEQLPRPDVTLPDTVRWAADVVHAAGPAEAGLRTILRDVVVVDDLARARAFVRENPELVAATRAGDLLGGARAWGGSAAAPSVLHLQAALDEAKAARDDAAVRQESAETHLAAARAELEAAKTRHDETLARLNESDAAMAAAAEHLGSLRASARSAREEAERHRAALEQAMARREEDEMDLAALVERLETAEEEPEQAAESLDEAQARRDETAAAATEARARETEVRLALRTAEERARAVSGRAQALAHAAQQEREARAAAAQRAAARQRDAARAVVVRQATAVALERIDRSLARAQEDKAAAEEARAAGNAQLGAVRGTVESLTAELRELTDVAHKDEVARAQQRLRLEQLQARAVDELGTDPDVLVEEFGPHQPIPVYDGDAPARRRARRAVVERDDEGNPVRYEGDPALPRGAAARAEAIELRVAALREFGLDPADPEAAKIVQEVAGAEPEREEGAPEAGGEESATEGGTSSDRRPKPDRMVPYVREEQEARLKKAERALARLGAVNPLALEEFAALEERHQFLETQLADLKKSREDLLQIVSDIDERVQQVFAEAFQDTANMFLEIFPRLFPGGEGKLRLTDPSDLLTTGIEVEARPAGKKVKRLSLLSGGERSLAAVAFLVSIFKARPSPFYIMDEVEAALDDVNLGRLIEIFKELQRDSQLIVITHQKRTMEVADALYGVTMRGDGVTTVISQRMGERETVMS